MDVAQALKEIEQGLGGKKHADELHKLLQLLLCKINNYVFELSVLQSEMEDHLSGEKPEGFYLGVWEDMDMHEEIHWVENQRVDGEENYTGWVLQNIVRPGKYQELRLGKRVRIITED